MSAGTATGEGAKARALCLCGCGSLAAPAKVRWCGPGSKYVQWYYPRYASKAHATHHQDFLACVDARPVQTLLRARGIGPAALGRALGVTRQSAWSILSRPRIRRTTAERILRLLAEAPRTPSLAEKRLTTQRERYRRNERLAQQKRLERLARAN